MSCHGFFSKDISIPTPFIPPPRLKVLRCPVTKLPLFLTRLTQKRPHFLVLESANRSPNLYEAPPNHSYPDTPWFRGVHVLFSCSRLQTQVQLHVYSWCPWQVVSDNLFLSDLLQSSRAKLLSHGHLHPLCTPLAAGTLCCNISPQFHSLTTSLPKACSSPHDRVHLFLCTEQVPRVSVEQMPQDPTPQISMARPPRVSTPSTKMFITLPPSRTTYHVEPQEGSIRKSVFISTSHTASHFCCVRCS